MGNLTIWEIDERVKEILEGSINPETGEIVFNEDELESLQMERERKIEHCLLAGKNKKAEADAIKAEIKSLTDRVKQLENEAERAFTFAERVLAGQTFSTSRVQVKYSKTVSTEVDKDFVEWAMVNAPDLLTYGKPTPNKKAIKDWINNGNEVDHAWLTTGKMMVK